MPGFWVPPLNCISTGAHGNQCNLSVKPVALGPLVSCFFNIPTPQKLENVLRTFFSGGKKYIYKICDGQPLGKQGNNLYNANSLGNLRVYFLIIVVLRFFLKTWNLARKRRERKWEEENT